MRHAGCQSVLVKQRLSIASTHTCVSVHAFTAHGASCQVWRLPPEITLCRVHSPFTALRHPQVGAGSVVTIDLPPACVAVGVPARIIKTNHKPPTDMDQCDDYIHDYVI
jgi:hypothetical protein